MINSTKKFFVITFAVVMSCSFFQIFELYAENPLTKGMHDTEKTRNLRNADKDCQKVEWLKKN